MSRLRTKRSALGLYGVLLVLPTLAFGWLHWHDLKREHREQLSQVPEEARDTADKVVFAMKDRLERLIENEAKRPFHHYARVFTSEKALEDVISYEPSPLTEIARPEGVLAWFNFDLVEDNGGAIDLFSGDEDADPELAGATAELRPLVETIRRRMLFSEEMEDRMSKLGGGKRLRMPLQAVAVSKGYKDQRYKDCIKACSRFLRGRRLELTVTPMELEFFVEDGRPVAYASRRVLLLAPGPGDLPSEAKCLVPLLAEGFYLHQGLLLDVDWLTDRLPREELNRTSRESDEKIMTITPLRPLAEPCRTCEQIYPIRELGFTTARPADSAYGKLEVKVTTAHLQERFASQRRRFMAVAGMLVLTLATGMVLLYRSVSRELQQAHRMQNFVAAVTHELRTPLSTIRLHGEMLLDGWTRDPERQREYYARIVRETDRLSTLVERVLEKSRLKERHAEPAPGDLNALVDGLQPDLADAGGRSEDLAFDLASDLPPVLVLPEAVAGILLNLVENARKYAPVRPGGEPILIRTREAHGKVLLEVADRGPGVPAHERERVFEAFYRIGREETRTTTGTGLGLHLVDLHARASGAEASVRAREGGGSVFEVAFQRAS